MADNQNTNAMEETKKKYSLYLFALNEDNISAASEYRFNRINQKYILIYTDELFNALKDARYHILNDREAKLLSEDEKLWLLESNVAIITEESKKNQDKILKSFEERLKKLESELEKETSKLNTGAKGADE